MKVIHAQNPDQGVLQAITDILVDGSRAESRNGPVMRFNTPVTTVWGPTMNRVSTNVVRDANPFLHYIEAFWMLAGMNDVGTMAYLAPNMANYSDNGETLHGAYGYRWRHQFGYDQIAAIINELRANPTSRRCVLQMWDGWEDLSIAINGGRDVPCNHAITFDPLDGVLNMTVSNRSNDTVWGCYGANVVHMSVLHEYVAAQAGMKRGTYYQVSSNLHLYLDNPVTKRMVIDGVPNPELHKRSVSNVEPLFHDIGGIDDIDFKVEVLRMFAVFNKRSPHIERVEPQIDCASLRLLAAMMNGFNAYKMFGASNAAIAYLIRDNAPTFQIDWIKAAEAWICRRPSFKE